MKPPVIGEGASRAPATNESSASSVLPKTLGRFRIEAALGGGSFGTVYRAFDPLVGEHVALKVLRPELSKNTEQMERLRREVVLARKVDHPGVCRIHDLHQDGETLFVVMELIEGETLDTVCARGALSPLRATRMIEDVCRALAAAHDVGVLHRDIKPSNVMVRASAAHHAEQRGDEVTLVDFGIATTQGLEHLTRPGVALGTVGYLAPELWEGADASPASDVFAAGVVLYGSLTLKMPWRASGMALAQQMRSVKPVPPSMFAPPPPPPPPPAPQSGTNEWRKIDEALDDIVLKAIAVDPDVRFANARAFADALRAWRSSSVGERSERTQPQVMTSAPPPRVELRDTTPVRTTSRAPMIGAAVGIAASIAIAFVLLREQPDPPRAPEATPPRSNIERAPLELTRPEVPPPVLDDAANLPSEDAVEFEPAEPAERDHAERVRPAAATNELAAKMSSARNQLTRAMKERELVTGDVPSADTALRSRLGGPRAVANLESALVDVEAVAIDRPFVERKLARLQARAAGRPPDAQLDNLAAGIAADIGARKYVEANRRLNRALALVR